MTVFLVIRCYGRLLFHWHGELGLLQRFVEHAKFVIFIVLGYNCCCSVIAFFGVMSCCCVFKFLMEVCLFECSQLVLCILRLLIVGIIRIGSIAMLELG